MTRSWIARLVVLLLLAAGVVLGALWLGRAFDEEPVAIAPESPTESTSGEEGLAARQPVHLEPGRASALGVTLAPVARESMAAELRAVVTIVPDESRVSHVHTRVAGWIERLFVQTTGETVRRGRPLVSIFSQELLASQSEYLAALRASPPGAPSPIAEGARMRLRVFGMTDAEIRALARRGEPARNVTVVAPRSGVVLHRGVSVGTAVDPSVELFTLADLSEVWAIAEVPEAEASRVVVGTPARIEVAGSGEAAIQARVDFVYPTLSERTRTVRVRFVLANEDGALRPGMFGTAVFELAVREALTVPRDAIVDTGIRQHVFVETDDGMFAPRTVRLGVRVGDRVEVLAGLEQGEEVVASGVFLVDSESRLRASGGGTGHAHGSGSGAAGGGSGQGAHEGHGPPTSAPQAQPSEAAPQARSERAPQAQEPAVRTGTGGTLPRGRAEDAPRAQEPAPRAQPTTPAAPLDHGGHSGHATP